MLLSGFLYLLASASAAAAQYKGFNYGSTNPDGSFTSQDQFQTLFTTAQALTNAPGFTSARLYTMIAGGTTNTATGVIQAAINTKTSLLLGLWASAGQDDFNNELAALSSAIQQYGTAFTDLIVGISVGSEDLYRISPTGIENHSGAGAQPKDIVNYIQQVRNTIANTGASTKPVGHVDTWTAWVNSSNNAVISACDFLGLDAYPYYQTTMANSIANAKAEWNDAYKATIASAQSKPVWVTETGWPLSGPTSGQAVASVDNAKTYWDQVGCSLFGQTNTWWYTLYDGTPSPSFGIVGSTLSNTLAFNLTCPSGASDDGPSSSASPSPAGTQGQAQAAASVQTSTTLTTSVATTTKCSTCAAAAPSQPGSPNQPAPSPPQSASSSASSSTCPAALTGTWQYPHLMVSVDSSQPSKAFGTSYLGTFNSTVSTVFNFDLPASYAGKACSLIFLFPTQDQLRTSSYTMSGAGGLAVTELSTPAMQNTTYSSLPQGTNIATVGAVAPGNSYVLASHQCAAGSTVSFELAATGSLALSYFQDYDPSPIGAYISAC